MTIDTLSRKILQWFDCERCNHGWRSSQQISSDIDSAVASMHEPLPLVAAAWKQWTDYESDTSRNDPGLHNAMTLCAYTEWCANFTLGLTDEPFVGVPRLVLVFSDCE